MNGPGNPTDTANDRSTDEAGAGDANTRETDTRKTAGTEVAPPEPRVDDVTPSDGGSADSKVTHRHE